MFALALSFVTMAGNFVMLSYSGRAELEKHFSDPNLTVHFYTDSEVFATTERFDAGSMVMTFEPGSNIDLLFIEVNEKIDRAMNAMPKDMERPKVMKASAMDIPAFYLDVYLKDSGEGGTSLRFAQLGRFARGVVCKRIEQLPQTAMVDISGTVGTEIDCIPDYEKLRALIGAVPEDAHMVHGDYHFRNIMYQNGESLLIDMDKLSHGHPIFELSAMYNAYVGFGAADPSVVERFFGLPYEQSTALWRRMLEGYLETEDAQRLAAVEEKVKIISCARLMRHVIHYGGGDSEADKRQIAWCRAELEKLLPRTDTLLF